MQILQHFKTSVGHLLPLPFPTYSFSKKKKAQKLHSVLYCGVFKEVFNTCLYRTPVLFFTIKEAFRLHEEILKLAQYYCSSKERIERENSYLHYSFPFWCSLALINENKNNPESIPTSRT